MAFILNIDTATETALVCISENEKVLCEASSQNQKDHASFLQPAMKTLLNNANIPLAEINAISITAGPGSYTGLRVAMAGAKGLCYALNIPLITLNTLQVMAQSVIDYTPNKNDFIFCPMIDARRMEVFTAVYDCELNEIVKPCAMIVNEFSFADLLSQKKIIFSGSGKNKLQNIITSSQAIFSDQIISSHAFSTLSYKEFTKQNFASLQLAEPFYLKEFTSGN